MNYKYSDDMEDTERLWWYSMLGSNGPYNNTYAQRYSALRLELKEFGQISESQNTLPCMVLNCTGHPKFPVIKKGDCGYSCYIGYFCDSCTMKMGQKTECPICRHLVTISPSSIDASCNDNDYCEMVIYCDKCKSSARIQSELTV